LALGVATITLVAGAVYFFGTKKTIDCECCDDVKVEVHNARNKDDNTEKDIFKQLGEIMENENAHISKRMSTCFILKEKGGIKALDALSLGLTSKSSLLKHEICYVMGQMKDIQALPILEKVLRDVKQEAIVRHEAGEALAAIGDFSVIPLLQEFINDPHIEVRETCQLAADGLIWQKENETFGVSNAHSVDPAPAEKSLDVPSLKENLLNKQLPLFKRYRAMFALRDINSEEAVEALACSFNDDSALLKHEVCFVFGQMLNPAAVKHLAEVLSRLDEHEMVRHEASEALGNIATPECTKILEKYKTDSNICVRESIEVGLGIYDFWQSTEIGEGMEAGND